MQGDQPFDERQPDPEPPFRAIDGGVQLREHHEEAGNRSFGETDAVVANLDHQLGVFNTCVQFDEAFRIGVLGCVGQQVADDLREAQRIGLEDDGLLR